MTRRKATDGFTIIELMVSIAIAAVLMGIAVPAFTELVRQRELTAGANDFVLAVNYARSEAIRRGAAVRIRARGADNSNEWGEGYDVVVVADGEVLRGFDALPNASLDAAGAGWHNQFQLTFNGRGMLTPQPAAAGTLSLCSADTDTDPGRNLRMSIVGRPDVEELVCHS